jgi:hypothetical protein
MAEDPAPITVDTTYLQAAQSGTVLSLSKEGPRPPGETGKYGPDVQNSLAPDVYPTGKKE